MTISVLNVDLQSQSGIWAPALAQHVKSARGLLGAFNREAERQASSVIGGPLLLNGVRIATNQLNKFLGQHFREEIEELAELLDTSPSDVLLANLAYDLANSGCSTFVQSLPSIGTLHARNLDWGFPRGLLKKHLVVAQVRNGKHGPYSVVTWPGLFGVLTGVAQGRFAITVNYVRHTHESN